MKEYRLRGWPELPPPFHRTAYRRMLHEMSQRYATLAQLAQASGLGRPAVKEFVDALCAAGVLSERGRDEPDSFFGALMPLAWMRRNRNAADPR